MPRTSGDTWVLYGVPDRDADLYHATGFRAPDPVACVGHRGRAYLFVSDLELARARREARPGVRVVSLSREIRRLGARASARARRPGTVDVVARFLSERRAREARVPASFPLGVAEGLRRLGVAIRAAPDPFFPARVSKTDAEARHVREALRATEDAIRLSISILRSARARRDRLFASGGTLLTAESLRARIDGFLYERGFLADGTIVACGDQGADPHERGHGPLRPGRTIVIDVFPRSRRSLYYGDVTRTVVRGRATEAVRALHAAVDEARRAALREIRAGAEGSRAHRAAAETFERLGFATSARRGRPRGFIHSTGHGIGLELHEEPRLSPASGPLPDRSIVTVEPGLYYPGVGAVRIEDVALVTEAGPRLLTRLERTLEI